MKWRTQKDIISECDKYYNSKVNYGNYASLMASIKNEAYINAKLILAGLDPMTAKILTKK